VVVACNKQVYHNVLARLSGEQVRSEIAVLLIAMPDCARPIGMTERAGWRPTATQEAFLKHLRAACETEGF
jgi:hypothetical protein